MKRFIAVFYIVIALSTSRALSQDYPIAPEIRNAARVDTLLALSEENLKRNNPFLAYLRAEEALKLSEKAKFEFKAAKSNQKLGEILSFIGIYGTSSQRLRKALKIYKSKESHAKAAEVNLILGSVERKNGKFKNSKSAFENALEYYRKENAKDYFTIVLKEIGETHVEGWKKTKNSSHDDYIDSAIYYFQSALLAADTNALHLPLCEICIDFGSFLLIANDKINDGYGDTTKLRNPLETAKRLFTRADSIAQKKLDSLENLNIETNIDSNDIEKKLIDINKKIYTVLSARAKNGYGSWVIQAHTAKTDISPGIIWKKKALELFEKTRIFGRTKNDSLSSDVLYVEGLTYLKEAYEYLGRVHQWSVEDGRETELKLPYLDSALTIANRIDSIKSASFNQITFESLLKREKEYSLTAIALYQTAEKEKIKAEKDKEITELKADRDFKLFIAIGSGVLVVALVFLYLFLLKRKHNQILNKKNEQLDEANKRIKKALDEKEKALNEKQKALDDASKYVESLLPKPIKNGFSAEHVFRSCDELGGDSLGYGKIDEDNTALYLLDVSGHGVDSSLLSVSALNSIINQTLPGADFRNPADVLSKLNDAFQMDRQGDKYFTIWYGVYNSKTKELTYATGGHPPAILLKNGGDAEQLVCEQTLAVGFMPGFAYQNKSVRIDAPSRLYIFSDGAYEVEKPSGEMMTVEELAEELKKVGELDALYDTIKEKNGGGKLDDDFSIIQAIFKG